MGAQKTLNVKSLIAAKKKHEENLPIYFLCVYLLVVIRVKTWKLKRVETGILDLMSKLAPIQQAAVKDLTWSHYPLTSIKNTPRLNQSYLCDLAEGKKVPPVLMMKQFGLVFPAQR